MRKAIHLQKHHDAVTNKDTYECTKTENNLRIKVGEFITEDVVLELINQSYNVIVTPAKR